MKRLLFPLLDALALPTAANAERHWLMVRSGRWDGGIALEKIEMNNTLNVRLRDRSG